MDSPREVRERLARHNEEMRQIRERQAKALKAAQDRVKEKQENEARERAHWLVRNNLNRPGSGYV